MMRGIPGSRLVLSSIEGQPHCELAAQTRRAFQVQPAAVGRNEGIGNAQAQAHALRKATARLAAIEGGKDALLLLGGNAWAGIADPDPGFVLLDARAERHGSFGGRVLDRVAEQVAQNLGQSI